ncbi:MAG TPA: RNA polymerase factor sigma-32 [Deltaproteobacteria bacterium]|jgi:RNA polymerase sigma-32 factor|nr:RNA polymerase factor sigma-32 [Deltaproteobacteria bacterium]OQC25708.1 MAG: RNA polymerase sigma factor RpoH [Deltaproteobacteria bacterium ADurb.Bin072]HRW80796.1 RNA polymerase factor sigma-32 [Desulfomonilia bacterium]NMD41199.1 RNA polymerase factor sigma-32 [Deltaproteobacteria bacterium]HNQ85319.1 RNA polymerase factor sigma-32 [Deltaproteobacteria bacterium]
MQLPVLHNSAVADLVAKFDQVPGLTKEEEFDLAVRLREDGDVDAAHRLITANLRNVVRIAMDYAGYGLPLEDIVQEGTIGLMIAVKRFDPHKGYRLMTYAVWWIKAMIHDHILRFFSQVKLGTTKLQKRLFYGLNRLSAEADVMDEHITEQSHALSARLDADPQQIEEIISRLTNRDQSLDSPMTDGSDTSFLDFLADTRMTPEDRVMESQRSSFVKKQIESALERLTPRERDIAQHRLMAENPLTLEDLGRQYAISKERVRQIENNVKVKLRKALAGHLDLMLP